MLYELINPSDTICFEAPTDKIVDLVVLRLSGNFGWKNLDTGEEGGYWNFKNPEDFFKFHEIDSLDIPDDYIIPNKEIMLTCFRSFGYCAADKISWNVYQEQLLNASHLTTFLKMVEEERRTSAFRIVQLAHELGGLKY